MRILLGYSGSVYSANIKRFNPYRKLFISSIFFFCVSISHLYAAFDRFPQPPGCVASSLSSIFQVSAENLQCNPASLAFGHNILSHIYYAPSPYGIDALSFGGVVLVIPEGEMTGAVSFTSFGYEIYREMTGTYSHALCLSEKFSIGINININSLRIARYGSAVSFGLDFSTMYQITEGIQWGFSLLNWNGPSLGQNREKLPRWYATGLSFEPASFARLNLVILKDINYPVSLRTGIDIMPFDGISFRCGVSQHPSKISGGVHILYHDVGVSYGAAMDTDLGLLHTIGLEVTY
jgi:hypothetical protein